MRRTWLKITQQAKSRDLNPGLSPVECRLLTSTVRAHHEVLGQRESAVVYSGDDDDAFLGFDYNGRLLGND